MKTTFTNINPEIQKKFTHGFRWTLFGSVVYETLKIIHCLLLMKLLSTVDYGAMGSLFSLIYLVTYIADLGATNSIPPFLHIFVQSRSTFKSFLIRYSLIPHTPLLFICATGGTIFALSKLSPLPYLFIIPAIIILETIRSFMRVLLHTTFQAKRAVVVELTILILYLFTIWAPFVIFNSPITLNRIFIPHLVDSIITVACFAFLIMKFYKTLPIDESKHLPATLAKRLLITRLFNYLLRVSRNMFTSNFLTPLFAIKFGLAAAGVFYFASILANAIQAMVKAVIGYSGNALLASIKESGQSVKKEAFNILCQKLIRLTAPFVIFLAINHKAIIKLSVAPNATSHTISLCLLFLIISFSEFFFILYEQFYVIEEAANKLFFFKLLELSIFYGLITSEVISSPATTLVGLICIRLVSFTIIAINAFYYWRIKPSFKANISYLAGWTAVSLIVAFFW